MRFLLRSKFLRSLLLSITLFFERFMIILQHVFSAFKELCDRKKGVELSSQVYCRVLSLTQHKTILNFHHRDKQT